MYDHKYHASSSFSMYAYNGEIYSIFARVPDVKFKKPMLPIRKKKCSYFWRRWCAEWYKYSEMLHEAYSLPWNGVIESLHSWTSSVTFDLWFDVVFYVHATRIWVYRVKRTEIRLTVENRNLSFKMPTSYLQRAHFFFTVLFNRVYQNCYLWNYIPWSMGCRERGAKGVTYIDFRPSK